MKKSKNTKNQEPVTEFIVESYGTLRMANFVEPKIRSEFYDFISSNWSESPAYLSDAMEECQPLAWAVQSIYTEVRDEIQSDLDDISEKIGHLKKRFAALTARLKKMPEEPEEGTETWLLSLSTTEFQEHVVPEIEKWFNDPPNWNWEDDYLPRGGTSQGAALEFFHYMASNDLDVIGVVIVEGEHPGSTYYAAELKIDVDAANKAAEDASIPVRFKRDEELGNEKAI